MNYSKAMTQHQPQTQRDTAKNIPCGRYCRRPFVVAQWVPDDACTCNVLLNALALGDIGPVFCLLEADEVDATASS